MLIWLGQRILSSLLLVFLQITAVYFVVRLAPGDPLDLMMVEGFSAEERESVSQQYGLDQSLPRQYLRWVSDLVRGDVGVSLSQHQSVATIISETLPVTLLLTISAYTLQLLLAIFAAVIMSTKRGSLGDGLIQTTGLFFYSVPAFWLGLIFIMIFSGALGWLPTGGMHAADAAFMSPVQRFFDLLQHMILPVMTLALSMFMGTARYLRTSLDDVLEQDYILAARARGVGYWRLMFCHALPNALLSLVTLVGLHLPFLLGGAVVVEVVFGWPGMGRVTVNAIGDRDYPVIMITTLVAALAVVLGSLLADIFYMKVDPRVRLGSKGAGDV